MNISTTKRRLSLTWFLLIMVCAVIRCEEDENPSVNTAPSVQLTSETIESFPNTQFTISATLSDEAGLKGIHLQNPEWLLNDYFDLAVMCAIKKFAIKGHYH